MQVHSFRNPLLGQCPGRKGAFWWEGVQWVEAVLEKGEARAGREAVLVFQEGNQFLAFF